MRQKVNVGITSLILIFIVLCLSTFGLLSASSAKGEWNLAEKNMNSVKKYYEVDMQGVSFLKEVDEIVKEGYNSKWNGKTKDIYLKEKMPEFFTGDSVIQSEIAMDYGQVLHIILKVEDNGVLEVQKWSVVNKEDLEIDTKLPLWTGDL